MTLFLRIKYHAHVYWSSDASKVNVLKNVSKGVAMSALVSKWQPTASHSNTNKHTLRDTGTVDVADASITLPLRRLRVPLLS